MDHIPHKYTYRQTMLEIIYPATQITQRIIKTMRRRSEFRFIPEMPLTDQRRIVSHILKY